MKKLLLLAFTLLSLCAYAQSELSGDTIKNSLSGIKEQTLSLPKESKHISIFNESQPEQSFHIEQQDSIKLRLPPLEKYVEPLPWVDMKKIHFHENPFEMDFQRYVAFLLSPKVILEMYGNHSTYPAMGFIMQAGAGITYYSPDERWELSGGVYAANYSISIPFSGVNSGTSRGPQWDLGLNASVAYRINDRLRLRAFGQYSGYGKSNSFHGYMNPMYPQSSYGIVMELKVNDWLEIHGGAERIYDPTKMKWATMPIFQPVINLWKRK